MAHSLGQSQLDWVDCLGFGGTGVRSGWET
jgi:hypothetical protein